MKLDTNDIQFLSTVCRAWYMAGSAFKDWLRHKTIEIAPSNNAETPTNAAKVFDQHNDSQR